jgi:hypothetical protein
VDDVIFSYGDVVGGEEGLISTVAELPDGEQSAIV